MLTRAGLKNHGKGPGGVVHDEEHLKEGGRQKNSEEVSSLFKKKEGLGNQIVDTRQA